MKFNISDTCYFIRYYNREIGMGSFVIDSITKQSDGIYYNTADNFTSVNEKFLFHTAVEAVDNLIDTAKKLKESL